MRLAFLLFLVPYGICNAQDPTIGCIKGLAVDKTFTQIASKIPLAEARDATFEMLANQALPTKREQELIPRWIEARKQCISDGDSFHRENYPMQMIALAVEAENNMAAIATDLYNRKLTYGAFNKRRLAIADDAIVKITAVVQQLKTQQDAQRQSQDIERATRQREEAAQQAAMERDKQAQQTQRELEARRMRQQAEQQAQQQAQQADAARRQAAMQMLQRQPQPAPIVPYQVPVRPITNTNCYQNGNQMNCTTQ